MSRGVLLIFSLPLQIDKKIEQVFSTKPQIKKQAPVGGTASGAEIKGEQQGIRSASCIQLAQFFRCSLVSFVGGSDVQ